MSRIYCFLSANNLKDFAVNSEKNKWCNSCKPCNGVNNLIYSNANMSPSSHALAFFMFGKGKKSLMTTQESS